MAFSFGKIAAAFIMFVSTVLDAGSVLAQQRLPTIPPDHYTSDQKKAADEFLATRKVPVFGPFEPMMLGWCSRGCLRLKAAFARAHVSDRIMDAPKRPGRALPWTSEFSRQGITSGEL